MLSLENANLIIGQAMRTGPRALKPKIGFYVSIIERNEFQAACALQGLKMTDILKKFVQSYTFEKKREIEEARQRFSA